MLKIVQIFTCVTLFVCFLISYLDRQNAIVKYQLKIPKVQKEIEKISQENQALRVKIDHFEHPTQLMGFLKKEEYKHLNFYLDKDIICLIEAPELRKEEKVQNICKKSPSVSIASGVSHK